MKNITINFKNETLEITKSFERKACAYGSSEYIELANARKDFPNFKIVVKTPKSSNNFKGMNYDFMRTYIESHDNSEIKLKEFDKLIDNRLTYGEIKQWFISEYTVFEKCTTRAQWILIA